MFQLLLPIIYISFISLGLPDSLLGSAWPEMHTDLSVPVSYAGGISMIISACTVISSLQCDRMTKIMGTGKVVAVSVLMTAAALMGFSLSNTYMELCLWAIPYGLGAGCVDASLNNYVALHYESRHMSWLHCMWGIGATMGPYIMSAALAGGQPWTMGYRIISILQFALTAVLFISLPLWRAEKDRRIIGSIEEGRSPGEDCSENLSLLKVLRIPGAKEAMGTFFFYSALEQTTGLWASSYLAMHLGMKTDTAAGFASLFFIGITAGRALSGFLTVKLNDKMLIRIGLLTVTFGIILLLLPFGEASSLMGLIVIGIGCAPIYPSAIHSTPHHFGAGRSQAVIGAQMAAAYGGTFIMPPLFGILSGITGEAFLPVYLLAVLIIMTVVHERLERISALSK